MTRYLILFFVLLTLQVSLAQTNNFCTLALPLAQTVNYCSTTGQYNNTNPQKSAWFQFTAAAFDVNISVSGAGAGGTLVSPQINLYSDCTGTEQVGTGTSSSNVTTLYKGGLIIGNVYYVMVTGANNATGTFALCLNNYNPIVKPGQDCGTASFLCSTAAISQQNVVGAGLYNDEGKGTCLSTKGQVSESNSVWYKWQAANNGTLVFTITPAYNKDDIDWVLFDLDTTGDCANVKPANAIRCKAGYGVDNQTCPGDTIYYKTGLDFNETDVSEPPGCGHGQNGKVKFVTMVQGHVYALLVNNFSSANHGFTLAFTDQQGKAGTGQFAGPKTAFSYTAPAGCGPSPQYTFTSQSSNYDALKWSFGDGASIDTASSPGPVAVTYATSGLKTVTLQAVARDGCTVVATQQVKVSIKPPLPVIQADKNVFCVNDTLRLQATPQPYLTYSWTGPNNFRSDSSTAIVPVTGSQVAGMYQLVTYSYQCSSDTASVTLPQPQAAPVAAFHTNPLSVNAPYGPVTVQFINDSFNADTYLWDFGDGATSTQQSPRHTYSGKGDYNVKLTVSRGNSCVISTVKYSLVIIQNNNYIVIPNTFTPNGDGINDVFTVVITNIKSYHIRIYTRWGQQVYESTHILNSWDGTFNGKQAPAGVYYYLVDAVGTNNEAIKRSGFVTVIR